jgi:hypothetical protein
VVYIRYYHVKKCIFECNSDLQNKRSTRLNKAAFIMGLLSCFGVVVVGNFQETNILEVHLIGALVSFLCLHIYCWLQTIIAQINSKYLYSTKSIYYLRLILCIIGSVNTFLCTYLLLMSSLF